MSAPLLYLFDGLCLVFFLLHIPITVFVDTQATELFPAEWYPDWAVELAKVADDDPLMHFKPLWFRTFVFAEVFVQLPFFFVAAYAYIRSKEWIRTPIVIYGAHTATTVVPCLAEILYHESDHVYDKSRWFWTYLPFFVLPLLMVVRMAYPVGLYGRKRAGKAAKED